jgi:hypothetical protein
MINMVGLYLLEQLIEVQKCVTLSAAAASLTQLTIPITDEEASVTYYFVCKANNKRNIMDLGLLE